MIDANDMPPAAHADSQDATPARRIPVIVGPTASGKTALSYRLHERHPEIEIISADSRQIYIGMDIGTAKPFSDTLQAIPHHLIDILTPDQSYSAGKFGRDAEAAIISILERDKIPLIVGGTGFYIRALFEGLRAPAVDPEVYARLEERMTHEGYPALIEELQRIDPEGAAMHPIENRVKTLRALACYYQTGVPYSRFRESEEMSGPRFRPHVLCLMPDRSLLYERINGRVLQMIELGLVEETRALLEKGFGPQSPGMRTVGYSETIEFLAGTIGMEETIAAIQQSTRRYAKRQMTWFRNQLQEATYIDDAESGEAVRWFKSW